MSAASTSAPRSSSHIPGSGSSAKAHPANGVRPVYTSELGQGCGTYRDFSHEVGITGTPVIDLEAARIYLVAMTKEKDKFVQRIYALDLTSGAILASTVIGGPDYWVQGTGAGSKNGQVFFDPSIQNQRAGLLLLGR